MSTFDKVKNITVEQLSVDPEEVKNGIFLHRRFGR